VARITEITSYSNYFIVNFNLIFIFYWPPAKPLPGAHGTLQFVEPWMKNTPDWTLRWWLWAIISLLSYLLNGQLDNSDLLWHWRLLLTHSVELRPALINIVTQPTVSNNTAVVAVWHRWQRHWSEQQSYPMPGPTMPTSTCHSVAQPTQAGSIDPAGHGAGGLTRSGRTMTCHLLICGDLQSDMVVGRHYGPGWLCVKRRRQRARLVLGWVTILGFNSRCGKFISV